MQPHWFMTIGRNRSSAFTWRDGRNSLETACRKACGTIPVQVWTWCRDSG